MSNLNEIKEDLNIIKKNIYEGIDYSREKTNDNVDTLLNKRIDKKNEFFREIIQRTLLNVEKNKNLEIIGISELNNCFEKLQNLNKKIDDINNLKLNSTDNIINYLQLINNEISAILKNYGTLYLEDLLLICLGNNYKLNLNDNEINKLELLKKYFHPISYKVINKKDKNDVSNLNDEIDEKKTYLNSSFSKIDSKDENNCENNNENLKCYDISSSSKEFKLKINGLKVNIKSQSLKKTLIIFGVLDNISIELLNNKFILNIKSNLKEHLQKKNENDFETIDRFINSLSLNDYLINDIIGDFYKKFIGINTQLNLIKKKQIIQIVKEFIGDDLYGKRNTIINLLMKSSNLENQYLAYLLYDLLSNDANGNIDTKEQILLFDSFPINIKQVFRQAMKKTIQYTNELTNIDINKIPLEQQICLLKCNENVKEKAMLKLKEVKSKAEENGTKARNYLDGLLKIPFGIYKREPILNKMDEIRLLFNELINNYNIKDEINLEKKEKYTNLEILNYIKKIQTNNIYLSNKIENLDNIKDIKKYLITGNKKKLYTNIKKLEEIFDNYNIKIKKYSNLTKEDLILYIINLFDTYVLNMIEKNNINLLDLQKLDNYINNDNQNKINKGLIKNILDYFGNFIDLNNLNNYSENKKILNKELNNDLNNINIKFEEITNYLNNIKFTLDNAVHGHEKAKKQIERIIGQWINGSQDGYCFGFEGFPGVGKTSFAKKGLSNCLKDENGNPRPFAMIQIGGESNGSTLHGHNYTYVGSTWGSIVQILIDKKCMNPIIFIDEVDKISNTEQGKEIIGILTHLLDSTQNDCFQDKYFSGIDLDLSKALFILSYNDPNLIDKILLDRVHRIKFDNLSLEDKLIISKTYILPEIYKKMGLENMINIDDNTLYIIIDEYTNECGVRKLKEILFEIIAEINIDILKNVHTVNIPINLNIDLIKSKYLNNKISVKHKQINQIDLIGVINGLWANNLGKSGIIPIQASWKPKKEFLCLELTGMQGDVMKESMNVALTLAWGLTEENIKKSLIEKYSNEIKSGIHIHCPETSMPKDGPSAGVAITCAIYSLLNNKKINREIALTGEICLNGNVGEIGGLDLKINGAIKAGVKIIIIPNENKKDYDNFIEKNKNNNLIKDIKFYFVSNIKDVFEIVFSDN